MALTEAVAAAVEEVRAAFPALEVIAQEDGEGGAYVIIESVPLGGPYAAPTTWIGFRITYRAADDGRHESPRLNRPWPT